MKDLECHQRKDKVDALILDSTPEEHVDWLIEYHGLPGSSRETVVRNLEKQFRWHRLRGRIDRSPALAAIVELWLRMKNHGKG